MTRHAFGIHFRQPLPWTEQQAIRQMTAQLDAILDALDVLSLKPPEEKVHGALRDRERYAT